MRGHVEIDTNALGGDLVIVRSDGTPLYHFTVAVDDAAMAISHVIRGEDHLSNTPKHILLFEAMGAAVPQFAHLPLILNPDRTKMSKRKSQTAVADYRAQGFIPEAFVNYLALLGWSTGTEEEVLSLAELVERFELATVNSAGAVFDRERLEWLNGQWIRRLSAEDLIDRLRPFMEAELAAGRIDWLPTDEEMRALLPVLQERLPDPVRRRRDRSASCSSRSWNPTRRSSFPGAGTRPRPRPPSPPPARRSPTSAGSAGRRTRSSLRCGASSRSAAGRPATCSWPFASR